MYRFYFNKVGNLSQLNELIRVFIADSLFESIDINYENTDIIKLTNNSYLLSSDDYSGNEELKRALYRLLEKICGKSSDWGTLTGVRPLKPFIQQCIDNDLNIEKARECFRDKYLISSSKLDILTEIAEYQFSQGIYPNPDKVSIYVGIPFCPSRCSYCSFISDVSPGYEIIEEYLNLLINEIEYLGHNLRSRYGRIAVENIYFGGGTPTTLDARQLEKLIDCVIESFDIPKDALLDGKMEFTIEAGRPDTITVDKLEVLKDRYVNRISVNPQSLKDETLVKIGRRHNSRDTVSAIELAKSFNAFKINSDVIAGLPDETPSDFEDTLKALIGFGVDNITVHTLSNKRGSALNESDPNYYRKYGEDLSRMLEISKELLGNNGYHPYYIYRQKHQIAAMENIGWCLEGTHSAYNIRTMEDKQTILGLGAGAIGKIYFPEEDRIERVANISNYRIYMERFDDILARKTEYFGG